MISSTEKTQSEASFKSVWGVAVAVSRIFLNPVLGCAHDFRKVNGHQMIEKKPKFTYFCPVCRKRDFF